MLKKLATISFIFITCGMTLFAQNGRSLPFLELNADTRAAGMGDANMGKTTGMYIYNNPTAFFQNEGNIYGSYALGMYPSIDKSHQMYHAASVGYKLFDRHALMVGFRYLGGNAITRILDDGTEGKAIKPNDWAIDFAYALNINSHLSALVGGNFIQSYVGRTAYTGGGSLGLNYYNTFNYSGNEGDYSLTVDMRDLGQSVQYSKSSKAVAMPTSVGLGGSLSLPFSEDNVVNAALATRYYMLPSDAAAFTAGAGVEYEYMKAFALRAGYHIGNNNNYFTVGAGGNWKGVRLDVAYSIASQKEFNKLSVGISTQF